MDNFAISENEEADEALSDTDSMSTITSEKTLVNTSDSAISAARTSYQKFKEILERDVGNEPPRRSSNIQQDELEVYKNIKEIIGNRKSKKKKESGLKLLKAD